MVNDLPTTSQDEQYGINNCGTGSSETSKCQTAWIKYGLLFFETIELITNVQHAALQAIFVSGRHVRF